MEVAGGTLKKNLTTLGPLVFPLAKQIKFTMHILRKKVFGQELSPYIPDFRIEFQHFCVYTSRRTVNDVMQEVPQLTKQDGEATRYALRPYGNTSSASV